MPRPNEQGFSLIELIVVIAILAILAAIGIPRFNSIIQAALFAITKESLNDNYKQCKLNPNNQQFIKYTMSSFSMGDDRSTDITATINSECSLKMNMSTGVRTGWTDSYSSCVTSTVAAESLTKDDCKTVLTGGTKLTGGLQ